MLANRAGFSLVIDGTDIADTIAPHLNPGALPLDGKKRVPRLISLSLTERLQEQADRLEITLSNHDGELAPVKRGRFIDLALGWVGGRDVMPGLISKGRFKVDEVEKEGPPDTLTIRARSADLTGTYRTRRDRSWNETTLGTLLGEIARINGLTARIHPDLASLVITAIEQAAKSDAAFIRDLGERFDAVATVKAGALIFLPIGAQTNTAGESFGSLPLTRQANSRFRFLIPDRQEHDGAEAQWHDRDQGRKRTVTTGADSNPKRIKRSFASEAEARQCAEAESRKAQRGHYQFDYEMALGDPGIEPNQRVTLSGWDSEIDGIAWLVEEASHTLDASGGLGTSLKLMSLSNIRQMES
ncbi:phage late control D family protein [Altericroceibacterium endophyticum]|uniref:Phage late control D family protein n=1 Tax=Altericroceibacterium endophyticum TaxID=1808508 RepID=A0A6I4T1N6_9SPHN|nr:phage late control D family protein [Altericroceibacterium endophyticum]MXO64867.1 phage late control D family protein [Altericroceibacterium endophyticum]